MPLGQDLVAFWNLNNSNGLSEIPANYGNYTLQAQGFGYSSTIGKIGNGFEFTDDSQGLWTNQQLWNLLTAPTSFSVSFWLKIQDNTQSFTVMGNAFGSMGFHFDYYNFGHEYDGFYDLNWVPGSYGISFKMSGPGGPYQWNAVYANEATPNNTWTMVTATYDLPTTTMRLYLNGVLKSTYSNAVIGSNSEPSWHGFALNGVVIDGGKEYGTDQSFDALGFWTRALSATEITALYNSNLGNEYTIPLGPKLWLNTGSGDIVVASGNIVGWVDKGGYSNNANTIDNMYPTIVPNAVNGLAALRFSNSQMSGPNIISGTPCTIFAVVSFETVEEVGVFFQQYDSYDNLAFYRGFNGGATRAFRLYNGENLESTIQTNDNEFMILGTIADQTTSKLFYNKEEIATISSGDGNEDSGDLVPEGPYYLGYWKGNESPRTVSIAELIVYDYKLSSTEIQTVTAYLNSKYYSFSPPDIAGLKLWLKADTGVEITAGEVTEWIDQSGEGNDATASPRRPPAAGRAPTLELNSLNGKPTIAFNGAGQKMTLNSSVGGSTATYFIVWRNLDATNGSMVLWATGDNYAQYIGIVTETSYNINGRNKFILSQNDNGSGNSGDLAFSGGTANSDYIIATVLQDGSEGTAFLNAVSGTRLGTIDQNIEFNLIGGYEFGYELHGNVAEIIVYDSALSFQDRETVVAYLSARYFPSSTPSASIPSGLIYYPYKDEFDYYSKPPPFGGGVVDIDKILDAFY